MDVKTYAATHGITPQRVRQLARAERIPAHQVGRTWVIEDDGERSVRSRRSLSSSSQADLLRYFKVRTLEAAPAGYRRQRLAERVRELRAAENPAELLREYFANVEPQPGPAGAAIVRAAKRRLDDQVKEALGLNPRIVAVTPKAVSVAARDERLVQGLSRKEAAKRSGVPVETFTAIETRGRAPRGNLDGRPVFKALGLTVSKLKVEKEVPRG